MMRLGEKKKVALVLSGGGIKAAAFHLGVCLALREKGFRFAGGSKEDVAERFPDDKLTVRLYVGASAGAVISTFLAAGYSIEAIIDAFERGSNSDLKKFTRKHKENPFTRLKPITYRDMFTLNGGNFVSFIPNVIRRKSLVTGGIEALVKNGFKINGFFTTRGIERYLRRHVLKNNSFASLGVELFIVATQLNHTRKVIFGNFPSTQKHKGIKFANFATISDAVAASASLPLVFAPYPIKNQDGKEILYYDGEIRDTLSTHVAADHGADLVISSYSEQPYHFNEQMGSLHHYGIPALINQALYQVIQQKIEKSIEHQQTITGIMNAIDGYCKQAQLPDEHREKLMEIVAKRANYKQGVDYLYIHPNPEDHEMFFVDHFSLSPEILERIVSIGFRSAMGVLRQHDI